MHAKIFFLLEKLRIGTYEIENLHLIDEATTRCLDFSVSRLCTTLLILEKTVAQWWGRWGSTYISLSLLPYHITMFTRQVAACLVVQASFFSVAPLSAHNMATLNEIKLPC